MIDEIGRRGREGGTAVLGGKIMMIMMVMRELLCGDDDDDIESIFISRWWSG